MKYILIFLILLFASCAKLKYGNVLEKKYIPEHTDMILMPMPMGKSTMMIPEFFHYQEVYRLKVKGMSTKGKPLTKYVYVSKNQGDTIKQGQFLCIEGFCDEAPKERINKK